MFLFLQDRHIKKNGDGEPFVDPSQDYVLLLGYENATHTVMRFKRKLDTCDTSHDIPITVSVWMIHTYILFSLCFYTTMYYMDSMSVYIEEASHLCGVLNGWYDEYHYTVQSTHYTN